MAAGECPGLESDSCFFSCSRVSEAGPAAFGLVGGSFHSKQQSSESVPRRQHCDRLLIFFSMPGGGGGVGVERAGRERDAGFHPPP